MKRMMSSVTGMSWCHVTPCLIIIMSCGYSKVSPVVLWCHYDVIHCPTVSYHRMMCKTWNSIHRKCTIVSKPEPSLGMRLEYIILRVCRPVGLLEQLSDVFLLYYFVCINVRLFLQCGLQDAGDWGRGHENSHQSESTWLILWEIY